MKPATAQTTRYLSHIAMLGNTRDDILPPGYTSITRTPNGSDANLSLLNKNSQCYLCVRYAEHGLRVTSLALTPRKKKDFPPGTRSGACGDHRLLPHAQNHRRTVGEAGKEEPGRVSARV